MITFVGPAERARVARISHRIIAQSRSCRQIETRILSISESDLMMSRTTQQRSGWAKLPQLPSPLYGAIVVALAVLLLGLLINRPRIQGYVVETELEWKEVVSSTEMAKKQPPTGDSVPQLSWQQIANAVRAADQLVCADKEPSSRRVLTDAYLARLANLVAIRRQNSRDGGSTILLRFEGEQPRWSIAFVDQLSRELMLEQPAGKLAKHLPGESVRFAKWRLEQSRHYERKARFDMEDALLGDLEQLHETTYPAREGRVLSAALQSTSSEPKGTLNPEWLQLQQTLTAARNQLDELLQTATDAHPMAQHLRQRIEELHGLIATTPQFLGNRDKQAQASAPVPNAPHGPAVNWDSRVAGYSVPAEGDEQPGDQAEPNVLELLSPRYHDLRESYELAIADREAAERRFTQLVSLQQARSRSAPRAAATVVRPASLVRSIGGEPDRWAVVIAGIVALVTGLLIHRGLARLEGLRRIDTLDQLARSVALPLVGRVSIDPVSSRTEHRLRRARLLVGCTRAAELVLFLFIALFAISALIDSPAGVELVNNPFGAIAGRVGQVLGI